MFLDIAFLFGSHNVGVYLFFLKVATTARSTQRALVAVADGLGLVRGDLILANS